MNKRFEPKVWRVEFTVRGVYHVTEIISLTMLDCVVMVLAVFPGADFERCYVIRDRD